MKLNTREFIASHCLTGIIISSSQLTMEQQINLAFEYSDKFIDKCLAEDNLQKEKLSEPLK